jgi:hypothetical protein
VASSHPRNGLDGSCTVDESHPCAKDQVRHLIAGALRRVERDATALLHLTTFAEYAGVAVEQAAKLFTAFFEA